MFNLLNYSLSMPSLLSKPVPCSVVSVEGQRQDVDPVEEEGNIWLTGVGLFGESNDILQKFLPFF